MKKFLIFLFLAVSAFAQGIEVQPTTDKFLDFGAGVTGLGYQLVNPRAASVGNQAWSPYLYLKGAAWKSNATAASQTHEYRVFVETTQGSISSSSRLLIQRNIIGAGWLDVAAFSNAGTLTVYSGLTVQGSSISASTVSASLGDTTGQSFIQQDVGRTGYTVGAFVNGSSRGFSFDDGAGGTVILNASVPSEASAILTFVPSGNYSLIVNANSTIDQNVSTVGSPKFAYVIDTTDTRSGAGAVSVTAGTTKLTSSGVAQAITLANGVDGQIKRIIHDVDGGSMILTPATKTGWSTATFTNVGESLTLEYVTTRGWIVVGSYLVVVAP